MFLLCFSIFLSSFSPTARLALCRPGVGDIGVAPLLFPGESCSNLELGPLVATLPDAWHCGHCTVCAWTVVRCQLGVGEIRGRYPLYNNNNNHIQRHYLRFFTISSQRRELSPTCTLKWPGHVQHIERLSRASVMLRATWYEGIAQLLILTKLKLHLFELYLIG